LKERYEIRVVLCCCQHAIHASINSNPATGAGSSVSADLAEAVRLAEAEMGRPAYPQVQLPQIDLPEMMPTRVIEPGPLAMWERQYTEEVSETKFRAAAWCCVAAQLIHWHLWPDCLCLLRLQDIKNVNAKVSHMQRQLTELQIQQDKRQQMSKELALKEAQLKALQSVRTCRIGVAVFAPR
jgi:hypothetical protein